MKKIVICSILFLASSLQGMIKLKHSREKLHLANGIHLQLPRPGNKYPILIPTYCLPAKFKKLEDSKTHPPLIDLSLEMEYLVVESLAALRLFPQKKEDLLRFFKKDVEAICSQLADKTDILQLRKALSYLCFPKDYRAVVSKIYKAAIQLKGKNGIPEEYSIAKNEVIYLVSSDGYRSDDVYILPIFKKFLPRPFWQKYNLKHKKLKNIINQLNDEHVLDTFIPFPISKKFDLPLVSKMQVNRKPAITKDPSFRCTAAHKLKKLESILFYYPDNQILKTLIPLIVDHHVFIKYEVSKEIIISKCVDTLGKSLLNLMHKSPEKAPKFLEALKYFGLEVFVEPATKFVEAFNDSGLQERNEYVSGNQIKNFLRALSEKGLPSQFLLGMQRILSSSLNILCNTTNFVSSDGYSFPVFCYLLPKPVKRKFQPKCKLARGIDHSPSAQFKYMQREVETPYDRSILAMVLPLIVDYYYLHLNAPKIKQRKIIQVFTKRLATILLEWTTESEEKAHLLREALTYFGLTPLANLCKDIEPELIQLRKPSFDDAQRCLASLKSKKLSLKTLVSISAALKHRYGFSLVKELNETVTQESMRSVREAQDFMDCEFDHFDVCAKPESEVEQSQEDYVKDYLERQVNPSKEYKRRMALKILRANRPYCLHPEEVLDLRSLQDLELFCGQKQNPAKYVSANFPTYTEVGQVFLYRTIAGCTADTALLLTRQARIRALMGSKKFPELDEAFKKLAETEPQVFSFWDDSDYFVKMTKDSLNWHLWGLDKWFSSVKNQCDKLNTSPKGQFANMLLSRVMSYVANPIGFITSIFAGGTSLWQHNLGMGDLNNQVNTAFNAPEVFNLGERMRIKPLLLEFWRIRLLHLRKYFEAIDKITTTVESMKEKDIFKEFLTECKRILVAPEVLKLREKLKAKTFSGDTSFSNSLILNELWQNSSNILVAFNLVLENKNSLIPMIHALGELEIFMTSAKMLRKSRHRKVKYCFPKYDTESKVPYISIQGSWNPIIPSETVIVNSLDCGKNEPQNVIINGPNAGGKSSIMKGIILSIILAQSIGITNAEALRFTPFSKVQAYLNITDDQASGDSLFMSSVKRAYQVYNTVLSLPEGQFSLSVFDEMLNGTSTLEGEAAAFVFFKQLAKQKENLSLLTTHFKSLLILEKENPGIFANYRVNANIVNGKLEYPFTLEKGISNQNIAFNILHEQGFDAKFIKKCMKQLKKFSETSNQSIMVPENREVKSLKKSKKEKLELIESKKLVKKIERLESSNLKKDIALKVIFLVLVLNLLRNIGYSQAFF